MIPKMGENLTPPVDTTMHKCSIRESSPHPIRKKKKKKNTDRSKLSRCFYYNRVFSQIYQNFNFCCRIVKEHIF